MTAGKEECEAAIREHNLTIPVGAFLKRVG